MRIFFAAAILLMCSFSFADGLDSNCGDITKIKGAVAEQLEFYGDVNLALKCKNPKSRTEALICADNHLFLMYKLNSMAEVYALENATKRPINHKTYKAMIPDCKTKSCVCNAFVESTNDSLGGESPYYIEDK